MWALSSNVCDSCRIERNNSAARTTNRHATAEITHLFRSPSRSITPPFTEMAYYSFHTAALKMLRGVLRKMQFDTRGPRNRTGCAQTTVRSPRDKQGTSGREQ